MGVNENIEEKIKLYNAGIMVEKIEKFLHHHDMKHDIHIDAVRNIMLVDLLSAHNRSLKEGKLSDIQIKSLVDHYGNKWHLEDDKYLHLSEGELLEKVLQCEALAPSPDVFSPHEDKPGGKKGK